MEQVRLEKITNDNVYDILNLRVRKDQKGFVAENKYSIVHAYLAKDEGTPVFPFAIFYGKKPVGFLMIGYDIFAHNDHVDHRFDWFLRDSYIVWRLMIDQRYQGRGFGREAMNLAMNFIRTFPCGKAKYCWLSYGPENEAARKLYQSFGFREVPEACYEGKEMPAILEL